VDPHLQAPECLLVDLQEDLHLLTWAVEGLPHLLAGLDTLQAHQALALDR